MKPEIAFLRSRIRQNSGRFHCEPSHQNSYEFCYGALSRFIVIRPCLNQAVFTQVRTQAVKQIPISFLKRLQIGIAGHQASSEFVLTKTVYRNQFLPFRIPSDVLSDVLKCRRLMFVVTKHMIVRLILKAMLRCLENGVECLAEESHGKSLIGFLHEPQPQQMHVVRHQAIHRAAKAYRTTSKK